MTKVLSIVFVTSEFYLNETNVQSVEAEAVSANTIDVRWEVSLYNCDVIGYIVRYFVVEDPAQSGRC